MQRARSATSSTIPFSAIEHWHLAPGYLAYLKDQVLQVKNRLLHETGIPEEKLEVVFTAHSLPTCILQMGDPYPTSCKSEGQ